ncbi:hypothetical protein NDU88_003254 [Pleurodeles waltl]|uniref:Uncharacterized protein n=1 Tax=Pleurodeles waltl TaxID=8319 RepID=A0AAV7VGL9_PLEWA|nr:hypothetical protein NDU88_003254 [Pleurodeles waltl]
MVCNCFGGRKLAASDIRVEDISCCRCLIRQAKQSQGSEPIEDRSEDNGPNEIDLRELLMDVKTSLKTIDAKIDLLTNHLDHVKQRVDKYEARLDHVES